MRIPFLAAATAMAALPLAPPAVAAPYAPPAVAPMLDHVALYVRDADKSAVFYKTVFGLREVKAAFPGPRWLVLAGGAMLHLVPGRPQPVANTRWDHFAIACADMTAMIARLDRLGIGWSSMDGKPMPQVRPDGVRQIFIQDPDGYWVEINDALKPK